MKINKIKIQNFRLLHDTTIDIETDLSLVLGKNNTGKTSFLSIIERFLCSGNNFSFDDFNLDFQNDLKKLTENKVNAETYSEKCISLYLFIEYESEDNLEKISSLITNLDPDDNILIISFKYTLQYEDYCKLISDFEKYKKSIKTKDILYYLNKNHQHYFKIKKEAVDSKDGSIVITVEDKDLKKIINFQYISAKRGVANQSGVKGSDKTLSKLSSDYYSIIDKPDITELTDFEKKLIDTDIVLSESYKEIFSPVLKNIKRFGMDESEKIDIEIRSFLEKTNLLKDNTHVTYNQKGYFLPEDYNGLGYMNLIAILFTIHIKIDLFKKRDDESELSAINLLFIEEPEAHTHPQMQYIFIKNIKDMLSEECNSNTKINLQSIITTHSSHIASQSDFEDIKYFLLSEKGVKSKNLSELEQQYGEEEENKRQYQFLKQYLTLNRAEMFFSDKVIFIEGDTERILLPAMMKKIDLENKDVEGYLPLLSQHISIVEVGAYSQIFDKFLEFLEIKTLIITDFDSVKSEQKIKNGKPQFDSDGTEKMSQPKAQPVANAEDTSNASIKFYLSGKTFDELKTMPFSEKILRNNKLCIVYQTEEDCYHARSFEDSFIHINRQYLNEQKDLFNSLKNKSDFDNSNCDAYHLANNCINKKTMFATDILYYGGNILENWQTPAYIEEGLLWLSGK